MPSPSPLPPRRQPPANAIAPQPRRRPRYRAARAFYLTLFMGACLVAYALFAPDAPPPPPSLSRRDEWRTLQNDDEKCRLVRLQSRAEQCQWIKTNCPGDEDPGFAAYLALFYCRLPYVKPVAFLLLFAWLGLLFSTIGIAASDFFCINLSTIASLLGMGESIAGVTFLAFGNGSPDVFSTFAAMRTNSGNLAVGELFGAAGFITAVVAGSMALIRPFHVPRKSFVRDVGFFVVATAFSVGFLADGKLHLWECATMVGFYVFYVALVVAWHWWLARRRRRREKEAAARTHYLPLTDEREVEQEPYGNEDAQEGQSIRRVSSRVTLRADWSALENGIDDATVAEELDEDKEEAERERWMSELSSNMRLTLPSRSRRNTINPVRPSLVGALEFRAVLNSLQKSRNIQTIPLDSRRYSDDPVFTTAQQQDQASSSSDPASRPPYHVAGMETGSPAVSRSALDLPKSAPVRERSVSANDASTLQIVADIRRPSRVSSEESRVRLTEASTQTPAGAIDIPKSQRSPQPLLISVHPATPRAHSPLHIDTSSQTSSAGQEDAARDVFERGKDLFSHQAILRSFEESPAPSPRTLPPRQRSPQLMVPTRVDSDSVRTSPTASPRLRFRDDIEAQFRVPELRLPTTEIERSNAPKSQASERLVSTRLMRWWSHSVLPPPSVILRTLFPMSCNWHQKSFWEKCLSVVAAPSIFLLTITLPVVDKDEDEPKRAEQRKDLSLDSARSRPKSFDDAPVPTAASLGDITHEECRDFPRSGAHGHMLANSSPTSGGKFTARRANPEQQNLDNTNNDVPASSSPTQPLITSSPVQTPTSSDIPPEPAIWNRWLTIIQLFLAPIAVVFALYAQSPTELPLQWLVRPILICLLISLVLLVPLLTTTTPIHRPPIYRPILSLVGFVVSIAWISTIATQVVGALKALAVILNMSHAIMGLTIFAVGNSLSDLVADVTVAKLGYPVMALSACFGGPMLNILLGIGLSGSYLLLRGAQNRHEKHPDKGYRLKAYHIDVSGTLIVSGATLGLTLVGLLVAVPWNKWVMSRKIGWALILLWILSTVGNVVLEFTGWANQLSEG